MRFMRAALAIAAMLLAAGCLPVTSKTPVGTTVGLGADPALYGAWVGHSQDEKEKGVAYFHFLRSKDDDGAISALMVITGPNKNDDSWMSFTVRTAKLGTHNYLNAVETAEDGVQATAESKSRNIPLLYSFGRHHALTLYVLDEDKVKEAIQTGKIAGTIEPGDFGDVQITADAAALDTFMATPDAAKLFKVFVVLRRAE